MRSSNMDQRKHLCGLQSSDEGGAGPRQLRDCFGVEAQQLRQAEAQ